MAISSRHSRGLCGSKTFILSCRKNERYSRCLLSRVVARVEHGSRTGKVGEAALLGLSTLSVASSSHADAIDTVEEQVGSAVEGLRAAADLASQWIESGKEVVDQAAPVLKQGVETAAPIVGKGIELATPIVKEGIRISEPVVKGATSEASKILSEQGIDISKVVSGASQGTNAALTMGKEAYTLAKPAAAALFKFMTTTEPILLAEYAVGALALFYVMPPALSVLISAARGYNGDVSAAQVLDWITVDGNTVLVDVRRQQDKEAMGIPDVGGAAGRRILEMPLDLTDRKVRSMLRNPDFVELQVTALKIGGLKGIAKGKRIVVMDKDGSVAKSIAKELSSKGFKSVFVMKGGFSKGWFAARLGVRKILSVTSAEVVKALPGSGRGTTFALPPGR